MKHPVCLWRLVLAAPGHTVLGAGRLRAPPLPLGHGVTTEPHEARHFTEEKGGTRRASPAKAPWEVAGSGQAGRGQGAVSGLWAPRETLVTISAAASVSRLWVKVTGPPAHGQAGPRVVAPTKGSGDRDTDHSQQAATHSRSERAQEEEEAGHHLGQVAGKAAGAWRWAERRAGGREPGPGPAGGRGGAATHPVKALGLEEVAVGAVQLPPSSGPTAVDGFWGEREEGVKTAQWPRASPPHRAQRAQAPGRGARHPPHPPPRLTGSGVPVAAETATQGDRRRERPQDPPWGQLLVGARRWRPLAGCPPTLSFPPSCPALLHTGTGSGVRGAGSSWTRRGPGWLRIRRQPRRHLGSTGPVPPGAPHPANLRAEEKQNQQNPHAELQVPQSITFTAWIQSFKLCARTLLTNKAELNLQPGPLVLFFLKTSPTLLLPNPLEIRENKILRVQREALCSYKVLE